MTTSISSPRLFVLLLCAVIAGGLAQWQISSRLAHAAPAEAPAKPAAVPVDVEAMQKDVDRLKSITTSASVAMADVGFHFSNLWFAGQKGNWPLAAYYYNEGRNHIRWLVRITPMPKGPDGELVDLQGIFDGLDTSALKDLKDVIDKKDGTRFAATYRQTLEGCYSCHKAVGRPYLRPAVPTTPAQSIINLDPAATWPQ